MTMKRTTTVLSATVAAVLIAGLTAAPAQANRTWDKASGLTITKTLPKATPTARNRTWDSVAPLNRTWA